jgi:hypothetical protein
MKFVHLAAAITSCFAMTAAQAQPIESGAISPPAVDNSVPLDDRGELLRDGGIGQRGTGDSSIGQRGTEPNAIGSSIGGTPITPPEPIEGRNMITPDQGGMNTGLSPTRGGNISPIPHSARDAGAIGNPRRGGAMLGTGGFGSGSSIDGGMR